MLRQYKKVEASRDNYNALRIEGLERLSEMQYPRFWLCAHHARVEGEVQSEMHFFHKLVQF